MARRTPTQLSTELDDAPPCVWMTAGILAWRLCDRDFDCEHCPLDAALRGPAHASAEPPPACWAFPDDRLYHPGHLWVRQEAPGRMRCGIDALLAHLLRHARGVVLPAQGSLLVHGQAACWIQDGTDLIPLRSAASGSVAARNPDVLANARLLADSPYEEGWLFELLGDLADAAPTAHPAAQARDAALRQLASLQRRAGRLLTRGRHAVGPTAADGGEPLDDLRRMLGPERYHRLIRPCL